MTSFSARGGPAPLDGSQLAEIVLAVDGVAAAYPPPSVSQFLAAAVAGELGPRPVIAIDPHDDGVRIDARIATRRGGRSSDAARAVADSLLGELDDPSAQIYIQVARIH